MANDYTPQQIEEILQMFFDVAGTRQYIGARYVPVFGHGGDTPIEWDGGVEAYEPLSIVYHMGETYTSRRYVPAGVDIQNTDYWVVTANYNAQMEQYRQEVLSFQDEIDDRVPFPDEDHYPRLGTLGQVLSTLADGSTRWVDPVVPSDEQAEEVISQWLEDHPEATTTVEDGSVTYEKIKRGDILARLAGTAQPSDYVNNANNLPANSIIAISSGSTWLNVPSAGANLNATIVTINPIIQGSDNPPKSTQNYAIQLYFEYSAPRKAYMRTCTSSTWSSWLLISEQPANSITNAMLKPNIVKGTNLYQSNVFQALKHYTASTDTPHLGVAPNNSIVWLSSNDAFTDFPDGFVPDSGTNYAVLLTMSPNGADDALNTATNFKTQVFYKLNGAIGSNISDIYFRTYVNNSWTQWSTQFSIYKFITNSMLNDGIIKGSNLYRSNVFQSFGHYTNTTDTPDLSHAPNNATVWFSKADAFGDVPDDFADATATYGVLFTLQPSNPDAQLSSPQNFKTQILLKVGQKPGSGFDITRIYGRIYTSDVQREWFALWPHPFNTAAPISAMAQIVNTSATKKIAVIGDSITAGQGSTGYVSYTEVVDDVTYTIRGNGPNYPDAGPGYQTGDLLLTQGTIKWYTPIDGNGWSQRLVSYYESKFTNCDVINLGCSGISSSQLNTLITNNVIGEGFDVAIIMLGTNNRNNTSLDTLYTEMVAGIGKLNADGCATIIMACTPASVSNEESHTWHMEDVEHVLAKVAQDTRSPFVSLYGEFLDYCWMTGTTIDSLLSDGLHPNDSGYEVIYNIITRKLGLDRKRPGASW